MNKQQAEVLISTTFENTFDEDQYLRFLRELFNGQIDESDDRKFDYYGQYIPDSFKDYVRRYKRLGTYTDPDGNEIDLLIVILKRDSALERARTMQRNFAAYHLKRRDKETAIIAYTTEDRTDWRFSMVRREPVVSFSEAGNLVAKDELTPVRRYSFLVGQSERSHTAQQQLFPILEDDKKDPTLTRLEEAFNIETVTKEFFERYKALFLQLKEALDDLYRDNQTIKREFDATEIKTENFAKKLLGQIVFLYFLQKKGWLGVPIDGKWGDGSKNFLHELFQKVRGKRNYFNDVLDPLFYKALAEDRSDEDNIYKIDAVDMKVKIPFLNGGLFEPMNGYNWQNTKILINNAIFENIFETFDLYNFTVREDEPLEKEVAVDPEMLGKVFENLLEVTDRKSKGAFYTPREIVHYMCQESLINYLDTRVNIAQRSVLDADKPQQKLFDLPAGENEQLSFTESVAKRTIDRDDIATFIRLGEFAKEHDTITQGKEKETETYSFRMPQSIRHHAAKLDEALANIKICDPAIGSGAFPVGMMQEIIKAREVLTTYIGENDSRSLYHFKRQAIQESIYGVDIDPAAIDIAKLRLWLSLVVDEDDYHHIKPLPNLDYKIVCGNSLLSVQKDLFNLELFQKLETLKTAYFDETNPQAKQKQRAEIDTLITELTGDHRQFDMEIYFSEVFHGDKGFDVVIGNPPYVRGDNIGNFKKQLKEINNYKSVYTGTADLYVYFYKLAYDVLKPNGVIAFITSNKFMTSNYGKRLRKFLARETSIKHIIDFGELPIFEDAVVLPFILISLTNKIQNSEVYFTQVSHYKTGDNIHETIQTDGYALAPNSIDDEHWILESPDIFQVLQKMKTLGKSLENFIDNNIYWGVKTGFNKAFIINKSKRDELIKIDARSAEIIKPYLRGRDVRRWKLTYAGLYIIFTRSGVDIDNYPAVKSHLEQHKKRLTPGIAGGRKAGSYKWYEIQDNTAYYREFEKPKIIWADISQKPNFTIDNSMMYIDATLFMLPQNDKYLLGILNSTACDFYFRSISPQIMGKNYRFKKSYLFQIPIPDAPDDLRQKIASLAQECLDVAKDNPDQLPTLEVKLNQLVYQAYELNDGDIALIEGRV